MGATTTPHYRADQDREAGSNVPIRHPSDDDVVNVPDMSWHRRSTKAWILLRADAAPHVPMIGHLVMQVNDGHRHGRAMQQALTHRAEDHAAKNTVTVASHDEQLGVG